MGRPSWIIIGIAIVVVAAGSVYWLILPDAPSDDSGKRSTRHGDCGSDH